jgi:hypothetical protein
MEPEEPNRCEPDQIRTDVNWNRSELESEPEPQRTGTDPKYIYMTPRIR